MNNQVFTVLGIFVISIFSAATLANAETSVKSSAFEKTTLVEFTNNDSSPIQSVKMWLGKDGSTFQTFKSEKGWVGQKTSQGVLVFSTAEPLKIGQSVKFGLKTDIEKPSINWRTIDASGKEISSGKVTPNQISNIITKPNSQSSSSQSNNKQGTENTKSGGFDNAVFRIIPENPKGGDDIRVIGDGFPPSTYLDFLVNDSKVQDFKTDNTGHLVGRTKIPITLETGRIDLTLADNQGHKKTVSIRISESQPIVQTTKRLTINQVTGLAEPGETISVNGTGRPDSSIKITVKDPLGIKMFETVVKADSRGSWSYQTTIPLDAPLGSRQVDISDGVETITKTISVSVSNTIKIFASSITYAPGEKLVFNGTAKSEKTVQVTINDPIGKEIFSEIITPDNSGSFNFEYQTTQSSPKGTYAVFATQGESNYVLRIGLGGLPTPQIIAKIDKLNYQSDDKVKLTIQGAPKSSASVLIIDPSDKVKTTETVTMGLDGANTREISLSGFKSGIYTIVAKQPQSQTKITFSVGLQTVSGTIKAQTTKNAYLPGEGILVLGSTDPNTILNLELTDPDGKISKRKDIFSDKTGKFSDGTFRVPTDAKQGNWILKIKSGVKFIDAEFTVSGTIEKTFTIKLDKTEAYHAGDHMSITGTGADKSNTIIIQILDPNNVKIQELQTRSTNEGSFDTLWTIPTDKQSGKYTIKAVSGQVNAEASFDIQ